MSAASQQAELMRMMVAAGYQNTPLRAEYGELSAYDPKLHQAKFEMPMVLDENDQAQETGWLPLGTVFAGPSYGMQFPIPDVGVQALIVFVDHQGFSPVCAVLMYNQVDPPPFPDGKTFGWKDKLGNQVITTVDGQEEGDGAGAARMIGTGYASVTAPFVDLGADGLDPATAGVVRLEDDQTTTNAVIAVVQQALEDYKAAEVVANVTNAHLIVVPTVGPVTAQASTTVAANE
jgi:hypothetical protein